jgi:signal transduction histidine kinase
MSISTHSSNLSSGRLKHQVSDAALPVKSLTAPYRDESFFLRLWERANLIRAFIWNQNASDEAVLVRQVVDQIQRAFDIDFCFAALRRDSGEVLQAAAPEALLECLHPAFVSQSMDLVANARMPVKWSRREFQTGFKALMITPFPVVESSPLGFLMLAHSSRRVFTKAELLSMQALAGDVAWALRELRAKRTQHELLSAASVELSRALKLVQDGAWRDLDSLNREEQQINRIEANIEEASRGIRRLLVVPGNAGFCQTQPRRVRIELVPAVEMALAACSQQALAAGVAFVAQFSADLPHEFITEPVLFNRVLRDLAEYALEVADHGRVFISLRRASDAVEITLQISDPRHDRQAEHPTTEQHRGDLRHNRLEAIREGLTGLNGRLGFVKRLGEGIEISVCFGLRGS